MAQEDRDYQEIVRLRARVAELEEALEKIDEKVKYQSSGYALEVGLLARATLNGDK